MGTPAEDILNRIREENARRLEVAEEIAQAVSARLESQAALKVAEDNEKKALATAKKAGWTEAELARITGKPAPRRRARRASASPTSDAAPGDAGTAQQQASN